MFNNSTLGFCIWDIPALIVLIAIIIVFVIHQRNHKKRERDWEEAQEALAKEVAEYAAVSE